ncbi:hypothetical protein [uncultured Desulfovibrio sp.]|uniref:hypothetical protein n=1 Tax=uncultured Desulfovibrio sp. TaxID=167968 RepID=UPI002629F1AD|nr:hypothetical protein [uncultured Desulfovibrio sp.]
MIHIIKFADHCCNVDNADDLAKMLALGGVELTTDEITIVGMAGYESLVGPSNTKVNADGSITFNRPSCPTFSEVRAVKRNAINAGFDAAMTASLTMPSASTPPSAFTVYRAVETWKADDPDGFNTLLAIHTERRAELLAAVDAATTADAVQAITVFYAV